jgi:hypothetical protein
VFSRFFVREAETSPDNSPVLENSTPDEKVPYDPGA